MIIRAIKRLQKEKAQLQADIIKLTNQKKLLKSHCCDFCLGEVINGTMSSSEVKNWKYSLDLPFFKLKACERHLKELYEATGRVLGELSEDGWISVAESWPVEKGWYSCSCYNEDIWSGNGIVRDLYWHPKLQEFVDNIRYSEHGHKDISKYFWTKHVVAWQPLPKPYSINRKDK